MFTRALALLERIQERLALDRGSALSRALAERAASSDTVKPVASTAFHSIPDGSSKTPVVDQPSSSPPAKPAPKRKRKPVKAAASKPKRGKASAQTPTALPSGKPGK